MQTILVAGAGKSSTYLIQYLIQNASFLKAKIVVADGSLEAILEKTKGHPSTQAAVIDITDKNQRQALVKEASFVFSLMPPHLHIHLAKDCLQFKKNLITSSYISPEMKEMGNAVRDAGLMFMCEMGLDPGIDHMTASHIIHSIQKISGDITSFKSYCGGLIAPESDNNPWHYKFSWNPKNVITAGVGGAQYLKAGKKVEIPYEEMFLNNKKIKVDGLGHLAYYPNRNSLSYLEIYDLPQVKNFMRATLRYPEFCDGWNALIQLGLTSENDNVTATKNLVSLIALKSGYSNNGSIKEHVANFLKLRLNDEVINMLDWLGFFKEELLPEKAVSSADILLDIFLKKWAMRPLDKDMVVMQHEVEYTRRDQKNKLTSTLVINGENREMSAMAKTVGLPMAILGKQVMLKKIVPPIGVHIPNMASVYRPVLNELKHHGIEFVDKME